MTYLDEAYRRFKLPISVDYDPEDGCWWISGPCFLAQAKTSREATRDYLNSISYLAAVKELSHEDQ